MTQNLNYISKFPLGLKSCENSRSPLRLLCAWWRQGSTLLKWLLFLSVTPPHDIGKSESTFFSNIPTKWSFHLDPLLPLPIFTKLLQYPSRSCSLFSNLLFIWLTFILVLLLILLLSIIGLYVKNNNYNNNIKIIRVTKIAATPHAHF